MVNSTVIEFPKSTVVIRTESGDIVFKPKDTLKRKSPNRTCFHVNPHLYRYVHQFVQSLSNVEFVKICEFDWDQQKLQNQNFDAKFEILDNVNPDNLLKSECTPILTCGEEQKIVFMGYRDQIYVSIQQFMSIYSKMGKGDPIEIGVENKNGRPFRTANVSFETYTLLGVDFLKGGLINSSFLQYVQSILATNAENPEYKWLCEVRKQAEKIKTLFPQDLTKCIQYLMLHTLSISKRIDTSNSFVNECSDVLQKNDTQFPSYPEFIIESLRHRLVPNQTQSEETVKI